MKLAFISYEYPPDTAFGGIGTYVYMIARAMRRAGHDVEVFSASRERSVLAEAVEDGVIVHRVKCKIRKKFPAMIAKVFAHRYESVKFDLIESPEFDAEGRVIRELFPQVPMAVRLHTPLILGKELNQHGKNLSLKERLKALFSAPYHYKNDLEYQLCMQVDDLSSPSTVLKKFVQERWKIPGEKVRLHPNIFIPEASYLDIPLDTRRNRITFTGRLEIRKGVLALAKAIPLVLQKHPDIKFRFVGKPSNAPDGQRMDNYLKNKLSAYSLQVEFISHVPRQDIPRLLAETDICVYPSIWENFPYVCLEAMSAGRGIVASNNSGMLDMLQDINGGLLVDPLSEEAIANALIYLIEHPEERMAMGARCRKKILDYYSGSLVTDTAAIYSKIAERKLI